jgi:HPt (histidine-containing phosphotransfer) domain-containing protein
VSEKSSMLSQLKDIADRYLQRTLGDAAQLETLVHASVEGSDESVKLTEQLAHKIHGSGAMFGFTELSEIAGRIERTMAHTTDLEPIKVELCTLARQLRAAVQSAAAERGIQD